MKPQRNVTLRLSCAVALAFTIALAGCSTAPSDTTATATPSASATPETPRPTPSDTTAPVSAETCDTAMTDEGRATLTTDPLELREFQPLDDVMQSIVDDGGLGCYWVRPGSDIQIWFARVDRTPDQWEALRAELLAAGYTQTDDPFPGTIRAADINGDYTPSLYYSDGVLYYVSFEDLFVHFRGLA